MACFFRGFNFVRNFFIPSVIRPVFGSQHKGKIYLSPFSPRSPKSASLKRGVLFLLASVVMMPGDATAAFPEPYVPNTTFYLSSWVAGIGYISPTEQISKLSPYGTLPPEFIPTAETWVTEYKIKDFAETNARPGALATFEYIGPTTCLVNYGFDATIYCWYPYKLTMRSTGAVQTVVGETGHLSMWATNSCPNGWTFHGPVVVDCPTPPPEPLGCKRKDALHGNPCDASTGNKYQTEAEPLAAAAPGLARHYNSQLPQDLGLGVGWSAALARRLEVSGTAVQVRAVDGHSVAFRCTTTAPCIGQPSVDLALVKDATGYTLTRRDGAVDRYDIAGFLLYETTNAGLTTTYPRDSNGRLSIVTGPQGHTSSIVYNGSHIASVTDAAGRRYSYTYDTLNNLTRVDYPDNTARLYHYENTTFPNHLTGISNVTSSGTVSRYATYGYDASGKATLTQHANVGFGGPQEKFTLNYDTANQTTVTDATNTKEVLTFTTNLGVKNLVSKMSLADNKVLTQTFDPNNNLTCKQDEEGRVTTWTYNSTNQKLSETVAQSGTCSAPVATPATRTTTYQYLSPVLDLPTVTESPSVYGASKKRVSISYIGNLPTSITQSGYTPLGAAVSRTVSMTYNPLGQVTSIDGPRSDVTDVTTLAYNTCTTGGGCGQLQRVTNALGQITTYDSYDANGRLLQLTDPNGVKTVYTYDPRGRVKTLTQTAPGGTSRVTSYSYDAAGNVTSTSLPTGLVLTYTYDAANYLRRVTDSLGHYIDYGYDLKGNRTQTYTYDASATLVRTVDLAFDARNRVSQINAGGSITRQIADALGNLTKVTDPNTVAVSGTATTNNSYDALNRLFQSVDRLSGSTLYSYDANDRLKTVQAPNGASTQYQYDDLGNLLKEISPDRGTLSYVYDAAGNLTQQTDARGMVSSYTYDALNRLTRIDYPGTTEDVTYTYDSGTNCTFGIGRLCALLDESGGTAHGYDAFGNRLVQTHVELGITYNTFYTYDAGNRVTSITYPNGRVVNTPRDVLGRITSVATSVNGTAVTIAASRSYRPDGLLLGQNFGNGVNELRTYDTQGRLTYQSLASADTRLYAYDANGNLKGLQSLPLVGTYNYDALDRISLDQRTTTATTSSTFTYDANGNRKTENLGSYAYLANSNRLSTTPTGSITLDAAGNTLSDGIRSYTYNNAGHLSTVAGASYAYNAQRLRSRKIVGSQGTVYHYDLSGNLIAESDTTGVLRRSYVWADGQALAQIEAVTTPPPDIIVDNTQATFTGTWATSTSITGFYGANYRTNAKGTGKDKAVWALNVPTTGTYQVHARWVAASAHASNAPFTVKHSTGSQTIAVNQRASGGQWYLLGSYTFTAGTAGSVTLTDNANGTVIADAVKLTATTGGTTSEVVRYLHADHLNTPRLATNASGVKVWGWEGSAFGDTQPTGTVTINLRFPGQYYDAESGLHYNWNRYYDPKLCRYLTVDPIGLDGGLLTSDPISLGEHVERWSAGLRATENVISFGGRSSIVGPGFGDIADLALASGSTPPPLELNPYVYVANNPLRWTDPTGLAIGGGMSLSPGAPSRPFCAKDDCTAAYRTNSDICKKLPPGKGRAACQLGATTTFLACLMGMT